MSIARKSQDQSTSNNSAPNKVERTNAALRESGIDYQVEAGKPFDVKAFTSAALKRWPKVMARLHEYELRCERKSGEAGATKSD